MERATLEGVLDRALKVLVAYDRPLFLLNASEWSMTHRLAVYLEWGLPCWHIDCDYNRQGSAGDEKRVPTAGTGRPKIVRPDIAAHHRGMLGPEDNLLAIEFKKSHTDEDHWKLERYTAENGAFRYQHGLALTLGLPTRRSKTWGLPGGRERRLDRTARLTWFVNGTSTDTHHWPYSLREDIV